LTSAVSADPAALRRYRRSCLEPDRQLLLESGRLAAALSTARSAGLSVPDLDGALQAFARRAESHDGWVGEVGDAFAAADAGALPTDDDLAVGDLGVLRPPAAQVMFALLGGSGAIGERRTAHPVIGFLAGLVGGDFDGRGFDNTSGEIARAAGHAVSGFFAVGDIRDAVAHGRRGQLRELALDGLALIPLAGDVSKVVRKAEPIIDSLRQADRPIGAIVSTRRALDEAARIEVLSEVIASGHARSKHVVKRGEFPEVSTMEEFAMLIRRAVTEGEHRPLSAGREGWWHEELKLFVLHKPTSPDLGTAFRPTEERGYFERRDL
jgi:hypothetical protein